MSIEKIIADRAKLVEIKSSIFQMLNTFDSTKGEVKSLYSYWSFDRGNLFFKLFDIDGALFFRTAYVNGQMKIRILVKFQNDDGEFENISIIDIDDDNKYTVSGNVELKSMEIENLMEFLVLLFYNKI